jgi:hypothetical protein
MESNSPDRPNFELIQGGAEVVPNPIQSLAEAVAIRNSLTNAEEDRLADLLIQTRLRPREVLDRGDE